MSNKPTYYFSGVKYNRDMPITSFSNTVVDASGGTGLEVVCFTTSGSKTPSQILKSLEADFTQPMDQRKGDCSIYINVLSGVVEQPLPYTLKGFSTIATIMPDVVQDSDGVSLPMPDSETAIETAVAFLSKFQHNTMLLDDMSCEEDIENKVGLDKQTLGVFKLAWNMLAERPFAQKPVAKPSN